jgi:hypothetical protein
VRDQPPFPDASENPATESVHTFQLGSWFNSPNAQLDVRLTRFNGEHNAGIQVLNTLHFADDEGPLRQFTGIPYATSSLVAGRCRGRAAPSRPCSSARLDRAQELLSLHER